MNTMHKRSILILGAGLMQAPAIKAAQELNCKVIAVDANPLAVATKLADEFHPIDLKDIPELIKLAKKLKNEQNLVAVFTAATDFSVSVATIAEACNLRGHTVQAAMCASDKVKMRQCFKKHSVPSPNFVKIEKKDINNAICVLQENNIKFPITVKPADNMGARGCKLVYSKDDLLESLNDAVSYSRTNTAIAEEFIPGQEFSLEALVINKKIFITAVADRHIFFPPYFVEMGHTIPSTQSEENIQELIRVFKLGIKAIGLTNGAAKGDIFLREPDNSGKRIACVGEIAARLSGGYMSGWTVPYSSGLNVTKEAIKIALDEGYKDPKAMLGNLNFSKIGFSAERAWISIPGKIKKIYGIAKAKKTQYIKDVLIRSYEGDTVRFPKNNVEKCGNVLSSAPSYQKAVQASETAIKNIVLRLETHNQKTDTFLRNIHNEPEVQNIYEPNFFVLPKIVNTDIYTMLKDSHLEQNNSLYFPSCFQHILDTVIDIHYLTIREAITLAFKIEPRLSDFIKELQNNKKTLSKKSISLWQYFIRGSVQGLLYSFDSFD